MIYLLHHLLGFPRRVIRPKVVEFFYVFLHGEHLLLQLVPERGKGLTNVVCQLLVEATL